MARNRKFERRLRAKRGIRNKITGTATRPRLTVFRSNQYIYAQLIDDLAGHTLASATSQEKDIKGKNPIAKSKTVGESLAAKAIEAGITHVVFDRNGYRYHGRVQALAEGARKGGLQF